MKKLIMILLIISLIIISLISSGCISEEKQQKEYEECTAGCAAILTTEDYVTYHLCNEECKKIINAT